MAMFNSYVTNYQRLQHGAHLFTWHEICIRYPRCGRSFFEAREDWLLWLDKAWEAFVNSNNHNEGHAIELHADECPTYSAADPITSFSFGHGGAFTKPCTSMEKDGLT